MAIGVVISSPSQVINGIERAPLGTVQFCFAIAPHHPLAAAPDPLSDEQIRPYRAVAAADSGNDAPLTVGLLPGQDVLTVCGLPNKLMAHIRGLGAGFLPRCLAQPYLRAGILVEKRVLRVDREESLHYAWRKTPRKGPALTWWLQQLEGARTRCALLGEQMV